MLNYANITKLHLKLIQMYGFIQAYNWEVVFKLWLLTASAFHEDYKIHLITEEAVGSNTGVAAYNK